MARHKAIDLDRVRARLERDQGAALLHLGEAVKLVATAYQRPDETLHVARDRVSQQMIRSALDMLDKRKRPPMDSRFTLTADSLTRWLLARADEYPDLRARIPELRTIPRRVDVEAHSTVGVSCNALLAAIPGDPPARIAAFHEIWRERDDAIALAAELRRQLAAIERRLARRGGK